MNNIAARKQATDVQIAILVNAQVHFLVIQNRRTIATV